MKKNMITIVFTAGLLVVATSQGCKKAPDVKTADELNAALAAAVEGFDAYMANHSYADTPAANLSAEAKKTAAALGAIAAEAEKGKSKTSGGAYDAVISRAREGEDAARELAAALAAGPPAGDPAKATALSAAVGGWGEYSERVTGAAPPAETTAKGKGHHYGWYKNPAWARDPAARGTVPSAGTACPEERVRERERSREREREGAPSDKNRGKGDNAKGPREDRGGPGGNAGGKNR